MKKKYILTSQGVKILETENRYHAEQIMARGNKAWKEYVQEKLDEGEKYVDNEIIMEEEAFTKTNWRTLECIFSELGKVLINRVDLDISEEDNWNELMLNEIAKIFAVLNGQYEEVKSGITKEEFMRRYCKEM